jgi:flavin-dependent dehydrogenase
VIRADVIVVGGGPAGSSCAGALVAAGLDVVVIDRAVFPRQKVCAGWITPPVLEALGWTADEYRSSGRTIEPVRGLVVSVANGPPVTADLGLVASYSTRRCELDEFLLRRTGARLRTGEPVASIVKTGTRWVVNGSVEAPLLVGAGGHFCPVARFLGADPGRAEPAVLAQELEVELSPEQRRRCHVRPDLPELYFCEDLRGYGWCVLKGDYLNVGLGRQDPRSLGREVAGFVERMKERGRVPRDLGGKLQGHAYLLATAAPRRAVSDGVLLIGDSAGLAYPVSGEGIRPAVESGLLAAGVIVDAAEDYREARLAPYVKGLEKRFGRHERSADASVRRWLPESWFLSLGTFLFRNQQFVDRVVARRWFFHCHEQPLISALSPTRESAELTRMRARAK